MFCFINHSILLIWFFIELNLLRFVGLCWGTQAEDNFSLKPSIKYFSIQAFSSVLFMSSFLFWNLVNFNLFFYISCYFIFIKLGFAPFHLWVLSVGSQLNTSIFIWLLVPQKLIPLFLLKEMEFTRFFFIFIRGAICAIFSIIQVKIKNVLIISSVFSLIWIYLRIHLSRTTWISFFISYSIIILYCIQIILRDRENLINIIGFNHDKSKKNSYLYLISLFFLSGLPPSPLFFLKIRILFDLSFNSIFIILWIILLSMVIIYIYLNSLLINLVISFRQLLISFSYKNNSSRLLNRVVIFFYIFISLEISLI